MAPSEPPTAPAPPAVARETAEELEEQLRQARKMEAVGMLAAGIAHDFNNLLTVINGYNEVLLVSRDLSAEARRCVTGARDAGKRAAALVRSLLSFSRRTPFEPRVVNLNESVSELADMTGRLLPANIKLATTLEPHLRDALADPGAIQQILLNLVINSRDAMPKGGRLEIRTANLVRPASAAADSAVPEGSFVLLAVSDTGVGMDDETRQHLFEPFYTTKPAGTGTGLGLSIVHQIVKQSRGFLSVQSTPNSGTTVKIYLPCAADQTAAQRPEPAAPPRGGSETILLVEDNAALRELLRDALEGLGYRVLPAAGGREAQELFDVPGNSVDLLISEVLLTDSTGTDVAHSLHKRRSEVPVLYISGDTEKAPAPNVEFLAKPFTLESLRDRVRRVLDGRKPRRILFVDDDARVVIFASQVLRDAGFEVLVGGNGSVALSTIRTEPVDLLVIDLVMPEREGLETIMRLRKSHPELPIIAISGAFGGHFLKGATTLGARATLAKPFGAEELLDAVNSVLEGK